MNQKHPETLNNQEIAALYNWGMDVANEIKDSINNNDLTKTEELFTSKTAELKKRYWKLALKYHPDKQGGSDELFKLLSNTRDKIESTWKRAIQGYSSYKINSDDLEEYTDLLEKVVKASQETNEVIRRNIILMKKLLDMLEQHTRDLKKIEEKILANREKMLARFDAIYATMDRTRKYDQEADDKLAENAQELEELSKKINKLNENFQEDSGYLINFNNICKYVAEFFKNLFSNKLPSKNLPFESLDDVNFNNVKDIVVTREESYLTFLRACENIEAFAKKTQEQFGSIKQRVVVINNQQLENDQKSQRNAQDIKALSEKINQFEGSLDFRFEHLKTSFKSSIIKDFWSKNENLLAETCTPSPNDDSPTIFLN